MLLKDFIDSGVAAASQLYPTEEARSLVNMLCEHDLGVKNYTHIIEPSYEIENSKLDALAGKMQRLSKGEPIQYIIGSAQFCDFTFRVTPAVLIPRPETELLVSKAVETAHRMQRVRELSGNRKDPVRALDLCTGSGCIAWSLALMIPRLEVVGVDLSEEALEVAENQNFSSLLKERGAKAPVFVKADLLDENPAFDYGKFDIIVSNPPYIMESQKAEMRTNVLDYEPSMALFVPDSDPLVFYRAVSDWSLRFLKDGGNGFCEINELLAPQTEHVFKSAGFREVETYRDFYDKSRVVHFLK